MRPLELLGKLKLAPGLKWLISNWYLSAVEILVPINFAISVHCDDEAAGCLAGGGPQLSSVSGLTVFT